MSETAGVGAVGHSARSNAARANPLPRKPPSPAAPRFHPKRARESVGIPAADRVCLRHTSVASAMSAGLRGGSEYYFDGRRGSCERGAWAWAGAHAQAGGGDRCVCVGAAWGASQKRVGMEDGVAAGSTPGKLAPHAAGPPPNARAQTHDFPGRGPGLTHSFWFLFW